MNKNLCIMVEPLRIITYAIFEYEQIVGEVSYWNEENEKVV